MKNSDVGPGAKADHLTYIGDADVGAGATFGCGSITVNYDWEKKHRTTVGEDARIGCNVNLVAPVELAPGSFVAAGHHRHEAGAGRRDRGLDGASSAISKAGASAEAPARQASAKSRRRAAMCGIVGYVGRSRSVHEVLIDGLRRLEYRGYDSAGVAVWNGRELVIRRAVGKLSNLDAQLRGEELRGELGLGHTRWATHGKPTVPNAHPHRAGSVAIIHNGIVENYREIRRSSRRPAAPCSPTPTPSWSRI